MKKFKKMLLQSRTKRKWMLLILMVTEVMMLMMTMTMSMEIWMLDGPICGDVVQFLDMTIPKRKF